MISEERVGGLSEELDSLVYLYLLK
jgi:hypothetical protein